MAINIIVVDYFHNLFTSSNSDSIDEVVQSVDAVVTQDMNDSLMQPFSSKEIRRALFQISPSKAFGPDGMTALFFQKYWHIVGLMLLWLFLISLIRVECWVVLILSTLLLIQSKKPGMYG
jgi:hypothetical protein